MTGIERRRTSGGVELTEEVLGALVEEAEAGYPPEKLKERRRVPELVGTAEIREILGIKSRQQANELSRREYFPPPVQTLQAGRLWLKSDIVAFGGRWDRRPGRPARRTPPPPPVQTEPLPLVQEFGDVLREWTDSDVAMFALGRALGWFPADGGFDEFQEHKHVFWSNNDLGNALGGMLDALVTEGLARRRGTQFRWKDGVPPR